MANGESSTANPKNSRRIIAALAVVAAVALLAVAGLVGFIVADRGDDADNADSSSNVGAPADVPADEIPDLREVVEAFSSEGLQSERTGTPSFRDVLNKYGVPACAQTLIELGEAFGGADAPDPDATASEIVSVTQDGSAGQAVVKDVGGSPETQHWIYDGSEWKFTCEGLFDADAAETSAESSATTVPPSSSANPVEESTPVPGGRCWDREVGQRIDGLECRWSGENARWVEIAPATSVEEEVPLPESTPVLQGPCYSWENLQVRQGLVCINSTNSGYVWLPDHH